MANVFPQLSLPALLSQAVQPAKPNPLLKLKLNAPAASFSLEQPPAATPDGVAVGPIRAAAELLNAPVPPVRPSDLGVPSTDGIVDPSIVARQKGASPAGSGSAGGLTADDLKGLIQYQVGGVAGQRPSSAPIFTAAQWGRG